MLDKAKELAPEWTDKSSSDFGVVMVELLAYGLDILSFYQDKNLQESFLHTARTRKAIIDACKTYGYELSLQTPFVHPVTFTKSSEYLDDIVIVPANTKVSTDPQIGEDRKSTRLNSSHANISYAVFCLKKKTKT